MKKVPIEKIKELEKRIEALEKRGLFPVQSPPIIINNPPYFQPVYKCSVCGLENPPSGHYHITWSQ